MSKLNANTAVNIDEARAARALDLKNQINALEKELEEVVDPLRAVYGEEGHTFVVPGQGKVLIKKGSPGSEKTVVKVDEDQLDALDAKTYNRLFKSGVLVEDVKKTSARKPSVQYDFNV